jgi:hypothetical protein
LLKRIMREDEWDEVSDKIFFDYLEDNDWTELREAETHRERFSLLQITEPYVGKYISAEWVRKNLLRQTEDEIEQLDKEMEDEKKDMRFMNPMLPQNNPEMNGDALPGGPMEGQAGQPPQEFNPEQFMQDQEADEMKKKMRFMQPSKPMPSGQGPSNPGLPGG